MARRQVGQRQRPKERSRSQRRLLSERLFTQEFFEGGEFGFGHVQILFGGLGVLFLYGELGFGDIGLHALLGGDDIAAETITRGGLLFLQIIQGLRYGGGAAVDVVVEFFDFVSLRGGFGLGLRIGIGGLGIFLGLAGSRLARRLCRAGVRRCT